jgi:hypothetical protein
MPPDLLAFASRVLERALQQSGHMPPHVYQANEVPPPDDMLVDGFARRVVDFVSKMDSVYAAQSAPTALRSPARELDHARNECLARGLGACECWGDSLSCIKCGGRGAPGWRLPDRVQFESYVRPALRTVSHYRLSARNGHRHSPQP